jgi:hypothetical protein
MWTSRQAAANVPLSGGLSIGVRPPVEPLINLDGKRVAHEKPDCDLEAVEQFLKPYKSQLQCLAADDKSRRAVDGIEVFPQISILNGWIPDAMAVGKQLRRE